MMTHPDILAAYIRRLAREDRQRLELVINGDFLDFLAEEDTAPNKWTPQIDDPAQAVAVFQRIAGDPTSGAPVFAALAELLAAQHQLTVLLGNHDVELGYPAVRRELARVLGVAPGHGFQFICDNEAYRVGDALIEHGNRYDAFNIIDHDGLRRRRSLQSRGQHGARNDGFRAPSGSRLVAHIMNPLKRRFGFVDLLKPETTTVLPLLLALEPALRWEIGRFMRTIAPAARHGVERANRDIPLRPTDLSGNDNGAWYDHEFAANHADPPSDDPMLAALTEAFVDETVARAFLAEIDAAVLMEDHDEVFTDLSAMGDRLRFTAGILDLLRPGRSRPLHERLPALHRALRILQSDQSFRLDHESLTDYRDAAVRLCERNRLRCVVFGHTHLARAVDLGSGRKYLNSGTWANLLRVPPAVLAAGPAGLAALAGWVDDLQANRLDTWFRPTHVRLDLDMDGRVCEAHTLEVTADDLAS